VLHKNHNWLMRWQECRHLFFYPLFITSKKEEEAIRLNPAKLNRAEITNIANFSLSFILSSNFHFHTHIYIDAFHHKKVYFFYKFNWLSVVILIKQFLPTLLWSPAIRFQSFEICVKAKR